MYPKHSHISHNPNPIHVLRHQCRNVQSRRTRIHWLGNVIRVLVKSTPIARNATTNALKAIEWLDQRGGNAWVWGSDTSSELYGRVRSQDVEVSAPMMLWQRWCVRDGVGDMVWERWCGRDGVGDMVWET